MSAARRTPFVLLETSTFLSGMGNGVTMIALPWLVLERTGSPTAAGLLAAATAVPLLVASLFAGVLVDRLGRRRIAVFADILSAVSAAAIPLVDSFGGLTVPVLVGLAVVGAVFDPAGMTGRETLLPAAASAAGWRMERVNGLHEAVFGLSFLVGPGVGGVLIGLIGAANTLWVTAAAFLVSVLLVGLVRLPGDGTRNADTGIWHSTVEGLSFVWHDRLLRTIGILSMAIVALYLPVEGVILPALFIAADNPGRLGLVVMAMSAGGVLGALGYGLVGHLVGRRVGFLVAIIGSSVALLGMAVLPPFPWLVAAGVLTGLLWGPVNPLVNQAMQLRSPEHLRGRVVGVMTSSAYAAGPIGYLLAGPLVEWLGVRPAFLLLASALLVAAVAAVPARSLRALDDGPDPAPGSPRYVEKPLLP